ncbi:methylated-DNA--[protein]-cysteine S-methyltransferase [Anaerobacillus isosaccharinicus]|uniref:Methylated-DNA--protein-cysteine methyltransferase n=1 Tax=Anaerobacillus isosaccharinicus TaxID=1532552 RepID=A0A1S2L6U3_9BACI|nr:methylated-DNA--[protein]-cysteine S-methyltransferase [Anaerobacillus isosaccharinicus]MBA5584988.1 methylated-DNA--[protein]-cysteine S-methyltransferase [Anaerobacillus isosaccharinicus]QOY36658.1 methylated-DNA--[protein]-cysteine S-methyltransferase [Anaerobacillus isosaccharinicus]
MEKRSAIFYDEMDSPLGPLTVVCSDLGVCLIEFGTLDNTLATIKVWLKKNFIKGDLIYCNERVQPVITQLNQYFSGERAEFDLPIDLIGTKFQCLVWETLKKINYGETKSYKQIAKEIGAPKAVRAIGGANNKNPIPIIIPCHRVIGSNGALVGYGGGVDKKEILLEIEGVIKKIS